MPSQAQRDALEGPIEDWVKKNPSSQCDRTNGRHQLFDHVKSFMADGVKDKQVNSKLSGLLMKHRPGVFMPQRTAKGCIKKTVGALSSSTKVEKDKSNKKLNPKNNKKNNKKRKDKNDKENRAIIKSLGLKHTMRSKKKTEDLCEHLLNEKKYPILDNKTMSQAIEDQSHAIYIGTTKRALKERRGPALDDQTRSSRPGSHSLWTCFLQRQKMPSCASQL
jgi:hypothetical protein